MNETCVVKDLAIGNLIQVDAFDDPMVVRSAKKIRTGLDAGKLELALAGPNGEKERIALDPEERVKVVGKDADSARAESSSRSGKGKANAKPMTEANSAATSKAQASKTTAPEPKAKPSKERRRRKTTEGEKKMSCLDAAAKVLSETGQAMNCQELIKTMADKGYWTSPGGKTPAATLYSGILRELQTKGNEARFKKTERGKFKTVN
jgi:short subunit dehydrogenase-like uncharacterized protein